MKKIFHPVDPKQFLEFEENEELLEKRVFLYSDRKPLSKDVSWAGKNYKISEAIEIDVPGKLSQPTKAIYRLTVSAERDEILTRDADGFLFVYSRSTSVPIHNKDMKGSGVSTSQIHFWVYPMKKI
ncbi:MAG: hypothetical protein ACW967_04040 [Candidatus Hodarchaeales archaeon]